MLKRIVIVCLIVVLLGMGALLVYSFVFFHVVRVPTGAMANTIIPGDYVVVKKRSFGEIERGDLVVFRFADVQEHYLMRVIGLPGEAIQVRGTRVYVNTHELKEQRVTVAPDLATYEEIPELSTEGEGPYRVFYTQNSYDDPTDSKETLFAGSEPFHVAANSYFVMGDNRDNSEDSRYRGAVLRDSIFGKATKIFWSSLPVREQVRWNRVFRKLR